MKNTNLKGEEIQKLRKSMGFTQQDCADIVGVDIRTWQKYESDYHKCKQIYIDVISIHQPLN